MAVAEHQALPPGTRIESFEMDSVLGVGGFGITYKAFDQSLQRTVAIKEYMPSGLATRGDDGSTVLPNSEANETTYAYGLRRFLDEARTLARFNHPGIVRVSRYLEANATAYMVMDYEQGVALDRYLNRVGSLTEREVRQIFPSVIQALTIIHAQLFLHRDIKPANVFLRTTGTPVLLDFGAARQAMRDQVPAITAMLTPGYAPFEQYHSDERQGPSTDLYGVGATLFHCITGQRPKEATMRILALNNGQPDPVVVSLEALARDYSPEVIKVTRWMLEPYPRDRPQSGQDLMEYLVSDAEAVEIALRQGSTLEAPRRRAGGDTGSMGLSEDTVRNIATALQKRIGTGAVGLVTKASRKAASVEELTTLLADFVADESEREAFADEVRQHARGDSRGLTRATDATIMPSSGMAQGFGQAAPEIGGAGALDDELLARAEALLAEAVGPIARVLVRKAAKKSRNAVELGEHLARDIQAPRERERFLEAFESIVT